MSKTYSASFIVTWTLWWWQLIRPRSKNFPRSIIFLAFLSTRLTIAFCVYYQNFLFIAMATLLKMLNHLLKRGGFSGWLCTMSPREAPVVKTLHIMGLLSKKIVPRRNNTIHRSSMSSKKVEGDVFCKGPAARFSPCMLLLLRQWDKGLFSSTFSTNKTTSRWS